ncbi:NAD(P)-dependent oxidoreductase [Kozakia baliensis]|uniref:NAD(P)-dependent oxidoreductase n=1 Tax=Kozakia baliensis TaxID=153496 RepID=UPI00345B99B7
MSQTDIKTIGFIGYGAMGVRMGANLRRAGYRLVAYTPSRKSADPQTPILESPKTVAEQSDAIILCVPNDSAQASSLLGDKGILAGIRPDTLLIDCSTVSPGAADKLAEIGRQHGIAVLDAPMSGSTPEAEKGELVMLVGGEDATLERARPILEAVSKAIVHAGPAGSGARLKLVINGIMGATLNIVAEGVGYGLSAGLDRDMLFEALSQVAVISPHHKRKLAAAQRQDFSPQFPTRLMSKDMGLLTDAGRDVNAFMPGMAVADQALGLARANHADEDYSALIGAIEHSVVQARGKGDKKS